MASLMACQVWWVDRYADTLVAQFTSCGTERFKQVMADALLAATGLTKLYERSDANVRSLEGLPEVTGWLRGEGPTEITLQEHGWHLSLNIAEGHKTGFYLDQRDSRYRFYQHTQFRKFQSVLNCYCYTGGFSIAALAGGALHVTSIDSSGPALEKAKANVLLNGFDVSRTTFMDADVNASLRSFIEQGVQFDAIVLDPPKLRLLRRMQTELRGLTRTSIDWRLNCWHQGESYLLTLALEGSVPICFTRLWLRLGPMRGWMGISVSVCRGRRIIL
jgi:23S rRNA G2069 N7-methylase RlmK/C1962 C5-methylase RlmI